MSRSLVVRLLDVGQGESIIIDYPDGRFALIDGGPHKDARAVLPEIQRRAKANARFDFVAVTQWDKDHIAGIPAILDAHQPARFLLPGSGSFLNETLSRVAANDGLSSLIRDVYARAKALKPEYVRAPYRMFGVEPGVEAYALAPGHRVEDELIDSTSAVNWADRAVAFRNRSSMALWIRAWSRSLLITGEVEADQYREMQQYFLGEHSPLSRYRNDYRAVWIKLSHHGAHENNHPDLFKLFASRNGFVASASAGGPSGRYGHPHPRALARVHRAGGRTMCTNLGNGCDFLIRSIKRAKVPLDPLEPDSWLDRVRQKPPETKPVPCYGTISVELRDDGVVTLWGSSSQARCPYGGPTAALVLQV